MRYNRIFVWHQNFSTPLSYLTPPMSGSKIYVPRQKSSANCLMMSAVDATQWTSVTDRRTDTTLQHIRRYVYASRGKNRRRTIEKKTCSKCVHRPWNKAKLQKWTGLTSEWLEKIGILRKRRKLSQLNRYNCASEPVVAVGIEIISPWKVHDVAAESDWIFRWNTVL